MIFLTLLPYIVFFVVVIAEILLPRNPELTSNSKHWFVNAVLYLLGLLGARALFLVFAAIGISAFGSVTSESSYKVVFFTVIGTVLLFDFVGYFVHRLYHVSPALWKIHQIHHSDNKLDFSTAFRFHPLEVLITVSIDIVLIAAFDIPAYALAVHSGLIFASGVIIHANTTLFNSVDRIIRSVLVTPNMHRIHHSTNSDHYNKNFSVLLSFWDRFFNSYYAPSDKDTPELEYGVSGQIGPNELNVWQLLQLPFKTSKS